MTLHYQFALVPEPVVLEFGDGGVGGVDRLLQRVDLDLEWTEFRSAGAGDELVKLAAQLLQLVLLPLDLDVASLDVRLALGDDVILGLHLRLQFGLLLFHAADLRPRLFCLEHDLRDLVLRIRDLPAAHILPISTAAHLSYYSGANMAVNSDLS